MVAPTACYVPNRLETSCLLIPQLIHSNSSTQSKPWMTQTAETWEARAHLTTFSATQNTANAREQSSAPAVNKSSQQVRSNRRSSADEHPAGSCPGLIPSGTHIRRRQKASVIQVPTSEPLACTLLQQYNKTSPGH